MRLELSDDQMRAVMAKAILDTVTPEKRDELITKAIGFLMIPEKTGSYGGQTTSPLERAFQEAARVVAEKLAREALAADTKFAEQITKLFEDVAAKLFANEVRDKLVDNITSSVVQGLRARDY
jgi:hypothetical protein